MVNSYKTSRRNVTNKYQNLSDITAQPCTYCGLSGMHPKGIDCPACGRRCNICFKLNHFPTVCRTKMGHEKPHNESNPKLMKTVVQNDSNASSDDDFLVQATEHMRIKKVDRVTKDDTDLSDISSLEASIRRLEKDFNEAKTVSIRTVRKQKLKYQHSLVLIENQKCTR